MVCGQARVPRDQGAHITRSARARPIGMAPGPAPKNARRPRRSPIPRRRPYRSLVLAPATIGEGPEGRTTVRAQPCPRECIPWCGSARGTATSAGTAHGDGACRVRTERSCPTVPPCPQRFHQDRNHRPLFHVEHLCAVPLLFHVEHQRAAAPPSPPDQIRPGEQATSPRSLVAEQVRLPEHRPTRAAARGVPSGHRALIGRFAVRRPTSGNRCARLRHLGVLHGRSRSQAARDVTPPRPAGTAGTVGRPATEHRRLRPPPACPGARGHTVVWTRSEWTADQTSPWATCRPLGSWSVAAWTPGGAERRRSRPAGSWRPARTGDSGRRHRPPWTADVNVRRTSSGT